MKWNGYVDVSLMKKAIIVAVAMLIAFLTTSFSFGSEARADHEEHTAHSHGSGYVGDQRADGAIVPGARTPINIQTNAERFAGAYQRATRLLVDDNTGGRFSLDERLERIEALLEGTSDTSDEIDLTSLQRTRDAAQRSLLPQYQRQAVAIEVLLRDLDRYSKDRIENRIEAGDYDDVPGIRALWARFKERRGTAALKTAVQELLDRTMTRVEELQNAVTAHASTESASCSREEENSELRETVTRLTETVEDLEEKIDERVQQLVAPIVATMGQMNMRAQFQQLAQTPQGQQQLAQLAQQLLADPAVQTAQNPQALAQFQQHVAGLRERLEEKKEEENPTRNDQREIQRLENQIAQAEAQFADVQNKVMTLQAIRDVLNVVQPQVAATSAVPTLPNAVRFGMGINPQQAQQQTTGVNGVAPASATTQAPTQTTTQTPGTQFQNLGNLFNGLSGTRHPGVRVSS